MGVGEQHQCEGRAGGWRKSSGIGECRTGCREREPCVVTGRVGRELIAARERWDDGVDEGECAWGESGIWIVFRTWSAGLYGVRAYGVGVGHVSAMRGGRKDRSEHAGLDELRAACGEHERSVLGGRGLVKHGSQSERWWERVHECDDTWSGDGAGGALCVSEAGAEHVRADRLGIGHIRTVPGIVQLAGQLAGVDERREECGEPLSSHVRGSRGRERGGWQRYLDWDEARDGAWIEHGGEGMERVCEVRTDGMRADRVDIGHIGSVPGGVDGRRERAGDAERGATCGELVSCRICGQGVDERCAHEQRCWDRVGTRCFEGRRTGAMAE
jgi:hypothetical protein